MTESAAAAEAYQYQPSQPGADGRTSRVRTDRRVGCSSSTCGLSQREWPAGGLALGVCANLDEAIGREVEVARRAGSATACVRRTASRHALHDRRRIIPWMWAPSAASSLGMPP